MARIPFLLGGTAEIPVGVYSLIREKSFIPGVKLDIQTNEVVERTAFYSEVVERTAFCSEVEANGEDQMEVDGEKQEKNGVPMDQRFAIDKDEMYRKTNYGNEDIFLDGFEFESLRRVEPQAIRLIRFDKLSALKDSYRMGPSYYLYPIKNASFPVHSRSNSWFRWSPTLPSFTLLCTRLVSTKDSIFWLVSLSEATCHRKCVLLFPKLSCQTMRWRR